MKTATDAKGFVRVERIWKPGDAVCLRFPMSASVKTGPTRTPGRPMRQFPTAAAFALPIPDTQGPNTPDPAAKWKYALDVQGENLENDIVVDRQAMPAKWDWPLASPLKLQANGVAIDWNPDGQGTSPAATPIATPKGPERITLIPYGCTKFRVSMFPITERVFRLSDLEKPLPTSGK